ncbi:MAG TPA: hypothetical protein VJ746_04430 [Nitrospira sp.]|nr:hypothetical protein [Nitrospira sp.]
MGLAAYIAVVSGLALGLWRHPGVALAGILCMFGLEQWGQATTTYFVQHQTATNYLMGGILVLALMRQGIRNGFSILAGYPTVAWLTLVLFLYAFASTQWATRADISLELWSSRWPYLLTFLVLSPFVINSSRDLRSAYTAVFLSGGLLTFLLLFFVKWEARRIVLDHDLGNPLAAAAMAGMVAIVAILADPWPRFKICAPIKWAAIALCLALVVRSGSRGQLLGVIVVSIACWPISRGCSNVKQFFLLGFVVLFLGATCAWALQEFWTYQEYGGRVDRWSEQSAQEGLAGRFGNAFLLLRLAYQTPETVLFGLGNSSAYDPRILGIYPHFVPLEVLAEEGLVGFALYALVAYSTFRSGVRCLKLAADEQSDRLLVGGLLALYGFTVLLSLKQGSLLINLEPFMLAIVLGRYEHILIREHALIGAATEERFEDKVFAGPSRGHDEVQALHHETRAEVNGWM